MNSKDAKAKEGAKDQTKALVLSDDIVSLEAPAKMADLSKVIATVIVEKNLYTKIQNKMYVNVEGWQLAGALTGIYPKIEKVENLSQGNVYRYRAEVSLFNIKTKEIVGYGTAICTNTEPGKKGFAEYAVASMAQTRAVGKAYRLALGWLLKLAGYETTPAEEMDSIQPAEVVDVGDNHTQDSDQRTTQDNKSPSDKQLWYLRKLLADEGRSDDEIENIIKECDTSAKASEMIKKLKGSDNG